MKFNLITTIRNLKFVTTTAVLLMVGYQLLTVGAGAQTPTQVVLTWQANNFYRADFGGKVLVTPGTPVAVSAEVLENGKFADLSGANFIWYIDEKLQSRGEGLKEISFTANKTVGDDYFVRVNIRSGENVFESSVRIPISSPVLVLRNPNPNGLIKSGEKAQITAVPYFFNVNLFQDLKFFWQIDNGTIKSGGNDNNLTLNTGNAQPGKTVQITGIAQNEKNALEKAVSRIRLIVY